MTRLTIDSELRAKLGGFQNLIEFCDEGGRIVGFFHPVTLTGKNRTSSPISDEEIEAARKERTGRPLPDILADLDRTA